MTFPWTRWVIASLLAIAPLWAPFAQAEERVGVVLMHGKAGTPQHVRSLAVALQDAGYLVETPMMPWGAARGYDRSLTESHGEIDAVVRDLRSQGASRIVIGGHSMGANMAMGYAATHPDIDAVLAIGPGQTVESQNFLRVVGEGVARARDMIAQGQGDERAVFPEIHLGRSSSVATTARVYASYFDPDGLANMPAQAPRISAPLLWVVGRGDRNLMERGKTYVFDRLPANAASTYVEVESDHMGTPDAARAEVVDWLSRRFSTARQY